MQRWALTADREDMSLPRPVFPNSVYMITRRCTQRRFLLKPSKKRNAAWEYILAYAAKKTGVQLIWTMVESNHHHTGVYDPEKNISAFCRELHRLVAKHHNAQYGRFEYFWASGPPGRLRLEGPEDILDKLVYSITNPVKDHLVAKARQWPGVLTTPEQLCRTWTVERPKNYFRAEGSMPESIELTLHKPPGFEHMSAEVFRELVAKRVAEVEVKAAAERRRTGQRVLGRQVILRQDHEESPASYAKHFKLNPQVGAKSKWRRIEALRRIKSFVTAYREALARWRAGDHGVVFPHGTNMMRLVHAVRCAAAAA